ncbi:MAG: PPC domain-containing protein [Myxococcota bacterium]|nr:PPC domain-containing protein [Myxococcota bacterium]
MLLRVKSNLRMVTLFSIILSLTACIENKERQLESEPQPGESIADMSMTVEPDDTADAGSDPRPVDLGPPEVVQPTGCGNEDDLAPNQGPDSAAEIEVGFLREDLFICPETDDWFRLQLVAGQQTQIVLKADPIETDFDLAVLDETGAVVVESTGEEGNEQVDFNAPADGEYFIRVDGYLDEAAFYRLAVTGTCALDDQCPEGQVCDRFEGLCIGLADDPCGNDGFEPNDTDQTASPIMAPMDPLTGRICGADRDWFAFQAEDGDSFDLLVSFDEGEDIDVHVINADTGAVISRAISDRRSNPERLSFSHLPAGQYRIGLTLFIPEDEQDREVDYTIEFAGRSGRCEADRDCRADGLPICSEGLCTAPPAGAGLGERCGQNDDCTEDADLCFTGGEGGHDNFCTIGCRREGECGSLGANAYCQPISRNSAVCVPGCDDDDDCGRFYACRQGRCAVRGACRVDDDCGDGEACLSARTGDRYCGLPRPSAEWGADPEFDPNDTRDEATRIAFNGDAIEGLQICNDDDDWYRLVVPANQASWAMTVSATFRAGVDIDIYLYDNFGNLVASSTTPEQVTEVIEVRFTAPGSYYLRVDQFSSDRLVDTEYSLTAAIDDNQDQCTVDEGQCGRTEPLRAFCDEVTGACSAIEGNGQLGLGDACDSNDDCGPDAEFCWTFRGRGGSLPNICTIRCGADGDCGGVPGTVCRRFRQFGACLPQ